MQTLECSAVQRCRDASNLCCMVRCSDVSMVVVSSPMQACGCSSHFVVMGVKVGDSHTSVQLVLLYSSGVPSWLRMTASYQVLSCAYDRLGQAREYSVRTYPYT